MSTKSGFSIGQRVMIKTNWRSNQSDGRIGVVRSIHRAYHGGGVDVSTAIEIKVDLSDGKCHTTFAKYLAPVVHQLWDSETQTYADIVEIDGRLYGFPDSRDDGSPIESVAFIR